MRGCRVIKAAFAAGSWTTERSDRLNGARSRLPWLWAAAFLILPTTPAAAETGVDGAPAVVTSEHAGPLRLAQVESPYRRRFEPDRSPNGRWVETTPRRDPPTDPTIRPRAPWERAPAPPTRPTAAPPPSAPPPPAAPQPG
ncbi:MAG: hypothetical protein AAF909_11320, partial [Pseudomonadota bacterium]